MKIFICYPILFCFALFWQPLFAENAPENFSLNLKFSFPLLKSDVPQLRLSPDPGIEAVCHFRLFKGVRFGTGIGFEYGHHIWNKENAGIIWIGGKPVKTSSLYVYNFDFITAMLPIYIEVPIQTRFINALNLGFSYGRYLKNDFYLQRATLPQEPELNKSYVTGQIGLQIPLLRVKKLPLNIHPFIENRYYLTDKNEYQKNYYSLGIKLSTTF